MIISKKFIVLAYKRECTLRSYPWDFFLCNTQDEVAYIVRKIKCNSKYDGFVTYCEYSVNE